MPSLQQTPTEKVFAEFDKNHGKGLTGMDEMVYSIQEIEKYRKALEEIANHRISWGLDDDGYEDVSAAYHDVKEIARKALGQK